jgi:hypothetical protein
MSIHEQQISSAVAHLSCGGAQLGMGAYAGLPGGVLRLMLVYRGPHLAVNAEKSFGPLQGTPGAPAAGSILGLLSLLVTFL